MPRTAAMKSGDTDFPSFNTPMSEQPSENTIAEPKKRRGRKPKGGKVIKDAISSSSLVASESPNVILHLRCSLSDLSSIDRTPSPEGTNETNLIETTIDKVGTSGDLTYAFLQAQQPKASFVIQDQVTSAPHNVSGVDEDAYLWRKTEHKHQTQPNERH